MSAFGGEADIVPSPHARRGARRLRSRPRRGPVREAQKTVAVRRGLLARRVSYLPATHERLFFTPGRAAAARL